MYAIVSTGGKQYRVERGQTLLVERLPVGEGETCTLEPLLYVDGEQVLDRSQGGTQVQVQARVLAHERGPKLRVVKFKPKRGYRRRTGHRQELTRIEITAIEAGQRPRRTRGKQGDGGSKASREGGSPRARGGGSSARGGGSKAPRESGTPTASPKPGEAAAPSGPKEESDGS
jgi:large subunit ribosomal protein L21